MNNMIMQKQAQQLPIIFEATDDAEDVDGEDYKLIKCKRVDLDGTLVGVEQTFYIMAE